MPRDGKIRWLVLSDGRWLCLCGMQVLAEVWRRHGFWTACCVRSLDDGDGWYRMLPERNKLADLCRDLRRQWRRPRPPWWRRAVA